MKRTLSVLIENKPGALARIVGLFHQRGYNIDSLNVAPVFDGSYSRMTVTTRGTENVVEQITKQINKLIDVIKVSDLTEGSHHEIEYVLLKLLNKQFNQTFKRKLKNLEYQIIEQDNSVVVLGITGSSASVDLFLKALNKKSFIEVSRSGCMGMHKSEKHLTI